MRAFAKIAGINLIVVLVLAIAFDFALGFWNPHLSQLARADRPPIPAEYPSGGLAIYNPSPPRSVLLREWPLGSTIRKPVDGVTSRPEAFDREWFDLEIDDQGFVKGSRTHEKPDLSIAFLGGSTTECHMMPESARFPFLAGQMLGRETGLAINSYNAGVAGNTTLHMVELLLHKVIPLRPKFAVFMETVNDLALLSHFGSYYGDGSRAILQRDATGTSRSGLLTTGAKSLVRGVVPNIYALMAAAKRQIEAGSQPQDEFSAVRGASRTESLGDDAIVGAYRSNILILVGIARAHGIQPILMTQFNRLLPDPSPDVVEAYNRNKPPMTYARFQALYARMNEELRQVAKQHDLLLIDLDRLVPKDETNLYDSVHLTERGSNLVAGLVAAELRNPVRLAANRR